VNDAELLRQLAEAFEKFDPMPAAIGVAASAAGLLAGHASTALVLVADGLPGTRGGGRLGFAGDERRIELEIDSDGVTVNLTGVASGVEELRIRWPTGDRPIDIDTGGRFSVAGLPAGPLSLAIRGVVGPWFVG
jgi:hypothetical protein